MDPLKPAQIRSVLANLPDLGGALAVSVVLESISYGDAPGFDVLGSDGWRTRHDVRDMKRLAGECLALLATDEQALVVIVCDQRKGKKRESAPHPMHTATPGAMSTPIQGIKHLLKHASFSALLRKRPERLVIVSFDEASVRFDKELGRAMVAYIQSRNDARASIDLDPPDSD